MSGTELNESFEASRRRDELLLIASHELKTPLTALNIQIQTLRQLIASGQIKCPISIRLDKLVETSIMQINRCATFIDKLMDVSQLTSGRLNLKIEEINLSQLVTNVLDNFNAQITAAGCVTQTHIEPEVIGNWDRIRMEQIVINLLTNAMKYGAKKPIIVTVVKIDDYAKLVVRDHGIGIEKEHQKRIFDKFARACPKAMTDGMGLGLYIVKQILVSLGGSISVESESENGSVFTVQLPIK